MSTQAQYTNALRNSGGDVNNPMFQRWISQYGPPEGGTVDPKTGLYTGGSDAPTSFDQVLPDYFKTISSGMRGELPADTLNLLAQQAAERGVSSGLAGSQAAGYAGLKNLRDVQLKLISDSTNQMAGIAGMKERENLITKRENEKRAYDEALRLRIENERKNELAADAWRKSKGSAGVTYPGLTTPNFGSPAKTVGPAANPSNSGKIANTYLPNWGSGLGSQGTTTPDWGSGFGSEKRTNKGSFYSGEDNTYDLLYGALDKEFGYDPEYSGEDNTYDLLYGALDKEFGYDPEN